MSGDDLQRRIAKEFLPASALEPELELGFPVVPLADLEELPVEWSWASRIPRGSVAVIAGDGGVGKSTLAQEIAARVSRGQGLPGGPVPEPRPVVVLTAEEDTRRVIRGRMRLLGADLGMVYVVDPTLEDGAGVVSLPRDAAALEARAATLGAGLVVIDTGPAFLDRDLRSNSEEDVRAFLRPLARLAERLDCVVLVLAHLNTGAGGRRGTGSSAGWPGSTPPGPCSSSGRPRPGPP